MKPLGVFKMRISITTSSPLALLSVPWRQFVIQPSPLGYGQSAARAHTILELHSGNKHSRIPAQQLQLRYKLEEMFTRPPFVSEHIRSSTLADAGQSTFCCPCTTIMSTVRAITMSLMQVYGESLDYDPRLLLGRISIAICPAGITRTSLSVAATGKPVPFGRTKAIKYFGTRPHTAQAESFYAALADI
nr:hypothetical protein CFP56_07852 [Quercus suber]